MEYHRAGVTFFHTQLGNITANLIGNYYKSGPESTFTYETRNRFRFQRNAGGDTANTMNVYMSGNTDTVLGALNTVIKEDATLFINYAATPYGPAQFLTESAAAAYTNLTSASGAGPTLRIACQGGWTARTRDALDALVITNITAGTGSLIDGPAEVGGLPTMAAGTLCGDTDNDGMTTTWEIAVGSNPNVNDANLDFGGTGYTRIEAFIFGIGF